MEKEENKVLNIDFSKANISYSNNIFIFIHQEEVELAFGVSSPGDKINISERVYLSLPHFFRLRDIINKKSEEILQVLKEASSKNDGDKNINS